MAPAVVHPCPSLLVVAGIERRCTQAMAETTRLSDCLRASADVALAERTGTR